MNVIKDLPQGEHYLLIKLSGGADSSIVYYAVCEKFKNRNDVKIVVVTLDTDYKNQYIKSAKRIINVVKELTGKTPIKHITKTVRHTDINYVKGQDRLVELARTKYPITKMFSGITINPPAKSLNQLVLKNHERFGIDYKSAISSIKTRDKTRDIYMEHTTFDESGFLFQGRDKKAVKELYDKYDMMEKLYPYTFSCVSPPYKFENDMPIHCGYCFPCLERWYAFGRII